MARKKVWDVYLDEQPWFTFCVRARYYREAIRRAKYRTYHYWPTKTFTKVRKAPRGQTALSFVWPRNK